VKRARQCHGRFLLQVTNPLQVATTKAMLEGGELIINKGEVRGRQEEEPRRNLISTHQKNLVRE